MKKIYRYITVIVFVLFSLAQLMGIALADDITPGNPLGWAFGLESGTNGSGQFVTGPGTPPVGPPAGSGSAQLVVTATDTGSLLGLSAYGGTRLADIDAMSYWTYRTSASWSGMAPALQFYIDLNVNDGFTFYQGRLVFEPYRNGSPSTGVWEQWDAINSGNAIWWATDLAATFSGCTQSSPCTLNSLLTSYPDAGIHASFPGIGFKVGSGWASFDGNVDLFEITINTINSVTDTYNFENLPVNNITQNTGHATIQDAVDNAVAGDVLVADSGTYTETVTIDKSLTLRGAGAGTTILDGATLGTTTSGIHLQSGVTNVTIEDLTVQNYTLVNSNYAGISGAGNNDNFTVQRVQVLYNTGGRGGVYLNGPVDTVLIDNVTAHDNQGRGIVIWGGHKTNITITNNDARRNNCCGIELQDGTASHVTMNNNTAIGNSDSGMSALGLTSGAGANVIAHNTVTNNGRFGIEIKNPDGSGAVSGDGSIVVENNIVSFAANTGMNVRDHGGIVVFRRSFQSGNPNGYVDIPTGVIVRNNTVTGYAQQNLAAATSEGFGIVIEGVNHTVTDNTLEDNDVGIQEQGGQHPNANYVPNDAGDGDQGDGQSAEYFGRGNAPTACRSTVNSNNFGSGANSNDVNYRIRATTSSNSLVTNVDTGEQFCTIQTAIDDVDTLNGHTLQLASDTYTESAITVHKGITITGNGMGASTVDADGQDGFTTSVNNVILQNMTLRNSDTAINISGGSLTVRGNELYTSTLVFEASGGTFSAYANNIVTFTTGISTANATLDARHNWWGTHSAQPTGVDDDSWDYRLGAAVVNWGEDSLPDGAAISGGSGTGVIVDHSTTVPFSRPTSPTGTPCSNFYDFFTAPGSSGTWVIDVPINAAVACDTTFNDEKLFGFTLNGSNAPDTTCSPDSACWNLFSTVSSIAGSPRLLRTNRTTSELGGTPIVAGDQAGDDPTAITLISLKASGATDLSLPIALVTAIFAGTGLMGALKGCWKKL